MRAHGNAQSSPDGRCGVRAQDHAWHAPFRGVGLPGAGPESRGLLDRHRVLDRLRRPRSAGRVGHHGEPLRHALRARALPLPQGGRGPSSTAANVYANLHYHNYGATPVNTDAVFNFIPARKGTVKHHAQAFTVGTLQFDIPANGSASVTGDWHAPTDLNLVSVSTHQHRRGTDVLVHMIDAAGNDMGALVDSPNWEHPSVRWFQQVMRLQAGEGFRFTCSWRNPDDHPVHFGVTSEDEMCFVTGYFYPDDDAATVTGPG